MHEVYHLSFFNDIKGRYNSPAANDKINYLNHVFTFNKIPFFIFSFSWLLDKNYIKKKIKTNHFYFFKNRVRFIHLCVFFSFVYFIFQKKFFKNTNNVLIIYHSPLFLIPLFFSIILFKVKYILQLEELYSDVTHNSFLIKYLENFVIKNARKIISSSQLLTNTLKKDIIVIHGNYQPLSNKSKQNRTGHKTMLLYAGIIDNIKSGAFNAINICKFLSDDYELHIIGSGDVKSLIKIIKEHNLLYKCKVYFDGEKKFPEIINYSKKFHFGLSTQDSQKKFNSSSFPSKILFYLRLGLNVISSNSKSVSQSIFADHVLIYKNDDFEAIANFITQNKNHHSNSIDLLKKLDNQVKTRIRTFIYD